MLNLYDILSILSMQKKFIDIKHLIKSKNPNLLKWLPGFVIKYLERILHQNEINEFLEKHIKDSALEFCSAVISYLNIKIEIEGIENVPKSGGVTLAMNHPLGGMDALALVHGLKDYRTDLKYIVNDLLLNLEPMKELFVGVNKHGKNKDGTLLKVGDLFNSNKAICIFPAGMVSRKMKGKVRDLPWKKTFLTQSKKNNLPIVPIYIDGKLSNFFYNLYRFRSFLGIKANIEMLYLANELFKQKNAIVKFKIGKLIPSETIDNSKNFNEWTNFLRDKVYELEK
jgi:1-acyl-sn-glycerol-3-phosphate acyltransferase